MEEKIILIKIVNLLLANKNLLEVKELAKQVIDTRVEYPHIDWKFLDEIELKSPEEIKAWLDIFMNEVYI